MAYRLEGKDIVISGFEQGIADTPYQGIADMRNVEIISVPGEGMVGFKEVAVTVPPVMNAVAFTAQASGDTITVASTTGLYAGCAIILNTNTATGISTGRVYYVGTITATTFKLFDIPLLITPVDITADGAGTFTTYQYGRQLGIGTNSPRGYFVDYDGEYTGTNGVYLLDASNYAWFLPTGAVGNNVANSLIFLGNISGQAGSSTATDLVIWKGYLLIIGSSIDIADVGDLISNGPLLAWDYAWENITENTQFMEAIVTQEDDSVYFLTRDGIGSLIEEPGETFDPTDTTTYSITSTAITIPANDTTTCLAEMGSNIYIGGILSYIYVWDKISLGFNQILFVPEQRIAKLVGTDQNVFAFTGNRGRIYLTNGASFELFKKVPDYVTGTVQPYIQWRDASYSRNQLYFSFVAFNNEGTELTSVAGAWAIDLDTKALRMVNKITNSGYGGRVNMVVEMPADGQQQNTNPVGTGLVLGWNVSTTTYGIDRPSSEPYQSLESFIETDIIPVGTFLKPFSPSQFEWKTSVPLGGNGTSETIKISYRTNLLDTYTEIGTSTSNSTTLNGASSISEMFKANFEKAQWVQFKIEMSSNATTPTYCRLTEFRIRDFPSGTASNKG